MTKLPTASTIQDLTKDNILLVANAYIDQLCVTAQCDHQRAKSFIMTALRRAIRDETNAFADLREQNDKIKDMLSIMPHVALNSVSITPMVLWLNEQNISHRVIWFGAKWVYLFENVDDAILFKLKWYQP